jgi:ribosomal protein S27AE
MKKVRCTCSNCGKIKYLLAHHIDRGEEHFLCPKCDNAYIVWQNSRDGNVYVDDFLKSYAAKRCKSQAT